MKNIIKILDIIADKVREHIHEVILSFRRCVFCKKDIDGYICDKCKRGLFKKAVSIYCNDNYCNNNISNKHIYIMEYNRNKEIAYNIKYYDKAYYIDGIYEYLGKENILDSIHADIYTYVPTSLKSILKRGYNIPYLMLRKLAISPKKMFKQVADVEMKKLNRKERHEKIKGKYVLSNYGKKILSKLKGDVCILIADDIYTTGTTLGYLKNLIYDYVLKNNCNYTSYNIIDISVRYYTLFKDII